MAEPRMEPPDSRKRISGQQYFNENERQGFANRLHGYARIRRAVAACTGAQRLQRRRVVTTPDKPAGRGQKLHESDVKIAARELGLPILQPEKLRDPAFVSAMEELRPDLGIVIAFRMLPEVVWAMPRLGTFNLHASLLPQYRGAAPIKLGDHQRRIQNGRHHVPIESRNRQGSDFRPSGNADSAGR